MKGPAIYIGHVLDERGAPFDNVERELSELGIDDPFNLTRCNAYDGFLHFENKTNAADLEMIRSDQAGRAIGKGQSDGASRAGVATREVSRWKSCPMILN